MNIFKYAAKVCRSASRSLLAPSRTAVSRTAPSHIASRLNPVLSAALDRTLEAIARMLCVQSNGVMVCGASAASVAHFSNPHFSTQPPSSEDAAR
jgi:hypothetical protein